MTPRERLERQETQTLHPRAARSAESRGRERPLEPDDLRPNFQRDRDRILHSKSFRRLKGKTQVFLAPIGDHYRTRLTHTLEVAQVARTIGRALALNEDLIEAMALGHDLGHTPFGHAGERVLNGLVEGGFHHAPQSVRVVEVVERDGLGLNLCLETRDGILKHTKGKGKVLMAGAQKALTLEAEVVRVADIIAYVCHDLDDALRAQLLSEQAVPSDIRAVLGEDHGHRLATLVGDVVDHSDPERSDHVAMSDEVHQALLSLRDFLYTRVYESPPIQAAFEKTSKVLRELFAHFCAGGGQALRPLWAPRREAETVERAVVDFLSGMTDQFALDLYQQTFLPKAWNV